MKNLSRTKRLIDFDNAYRAAGKRCICGIDEAGRGPVAGPVVAAAVIFSDDVYIEGVYDSKKISAKTRLRLFCEIKEKAVSYAVGIIEHTEIDTINILEATKKAANKALKKIIIVPDIILADGNFYSHERHSVDNIIKGDEKSFTIAAASILAKVTRDKIMSEYEKKFPHYSFSQHKGYGTKNHIQEIIEYGFTEIHRRSFKLKALREVRH